MHLEVLAEDKSGSRFLEVLLGKIFNDKNLDFTLAVRPHRGKGYFPQDPLARPKKFASGLLDLLPAKLRAYGSVFEPGEIILVIVLDADDEDPRYVRSRLVDLVARFGDNIPYVIGICVEEIEAWMLGDIEAIKKAYPDSRTEEAEGYKQDSICGTWEILAKVIMGPEADRLVRVGYPAIGQYKSEWAEKIARHISPERNRSPSFREFYSILERITGRHMTKTEN